MPIKILQSTGLVAGTIAVMVVIGIPGFVVVWLAVFGLFAYSRLSGRTVVFSGWSWRQFVFTAGMGLGMSYALLLLSAGF